MDTTAAAVTFSVVEPEIEPDVAVIVVLPSPALLANPVLPDVLLMVATVVEDELQLTDEVSACVFPSLY